MKTYEEKLQELLAEIETINHEVDEERIESIVFNEAHALAVQLVAEARMIHKEKGAYTLDSYDVLMKACALLKAAQEIEK